MKKILPSTLHGTYGCKDKNAKCVKSVENYCYNVYNNKLIENYCAKGLSADLMKLIDVHTHIYPDMVAKIATQSVENFYDFTAKCPVTEEEKRNLP